jgi:two-component system, cell cycle sensor histidine kinase and response regulator CckA
MDEIKWTKPSGDRPVILLADADSTVRELGSLVLEREGYQVLLAEDGFKAMAIFQNAPYRVDLAIVDINIPRLAGDRILEQCMAIDPEIVMLFSSECCAEDRPKGPRANHMLGVICKPFIWHEVVALVRLALMNWQEWDCDPEAPAHS